jgi:hypothetical protein
LNVIVGAPDPPLNSTANAQAPVTSMPVDCPEAGRVAFH